MSARQGLCRNTWSFFVVNIIMLSRSVPLITLLFCYISIIIRIRRNKELKCCGKEMYNNKTNYHCEICGKRIYKKTKPLSCPICKSNLYDNGDNVHCAKCGYRKFL